MRSRVEKWDVLGWTLSHAKKLLMGGYQVEDYDNDMRNLIWQVVDDHVVEVRVEHKELGLQGFYFNLFGEERQGCVADNVRQLPYLLMIVKLCTGDWEEQIDRMNKKVDE